MATLTFDTARCKGCSLCIEASPKKILRLAGHDMNDKGYHPAEITDPDACIACAFCAMMCPDCVIAVEK